MKPLAVVAGGFLFFGPAGVVAALIGWGAWQLVSRCDEIGVE